MGLYWLVDAKESAVAALDRQHQERTRKTARNLTEGWSITEDDLRYILDADISPSPQETYLKFARQCQKYGFAEIMVAWLTETATSHPSLLSAESYIGEDEGVTVRLKDSKFPRDAHGGRVFSIFLLMASAAFDQFLKGQPYVARHQIPAPDRMFGRSPGWKPKTIQTWHAGRPRKSSTKS